MSYLSQHCLLVVMGVVLAFPPRASGQYSQPRFDMFGDPLPEGALARIGTARLRSNEMVNVVAFSPDGHQLAFGDERGVVRVCDVADGKLRFEFQPEKPRFRPITELAFSQDGKSLAVGGYWSENLWLYDLATLRIRLTIPNMVEGQAKWSRRQQGPELVFSPDGQSLLIGGKEGALHLRDMRNGVEQATLAETADLVVSVSVTADGKTALTGHSHGALHLWDLTKRSRLRTLVSPARYPQMVELSPDGKIIALATGAQTLELWEAQGGKRHELRISAVIAGLAFTLDGTSLRVADGNGVITTWDTRTGMRQQTLPLERIVPIFVHDRWEPRRSAWFRADGTLVAWTEGGTVRLFDLTTGKETPRLSPYPQGIHWAGFSADGRLIRAVGRCGELGVWDAATGRPAGSPSTRKPPASVRHSPGAWTNYQPAADGVHLLTITGIWRRGNPKSEEGRIYLGKLTGDTDPVPLREQSGPAVDAALTPDSRFVVSTEPGGQIRVYDASSGKATRSLAGLMGEQHPTFSPDGTRLATSGGWPPVIRLYDFTTDHLLQELKPSMPTTCLAFSPNGRVLASGHVSGPDRPPAEQSALIVLWDPKTGRELLRIPTKAVWMPRLSFSPDGRLIASCGHPRDVQVWEAASGQERRRLVGHQSSVQSVEFSPDGCLVTASTDGTALVWSLFDHSAIESTPADLDALWIDLAKDGLTAHRAMTKLLTEEATVRFLTGSLRPAVKPEEAQVKQWLADLGSPQFERREAAQKQLARVGEWIEPTLQETLKTTSDAEVRRRLTDLLENFSRLEARPEQLRELRAVEVLERIGNAQARHLLETLVKGTPVARLTREAKESLTRLERKPDH